MGAIESKSRSKREKNSEVSVFKYGTLKDDENACFIPIAEVIKSKDLRQQINGIPVPKTDINGWDSVSHRADCTIQISPISTTPADDDTWSSSAMSSNKFLENPLLKRADAENPLFLPADGEHRSVRPVNPCKLRIATEQIRLELEENGIINYENWDNYSNTSGIDPKEEGIIGEMRSVGIISHGTTGIDDGNLQGGFKRRLLPRLVHLPVEPTLPQKIVDDMLLPKVKEKVVHVPTTSKSDVGTAFLTQASPVKYPQKEKSETLERTLKLIDTDIL